MLELSIILSSEEWVEVDKIGMNTRRDANRFLELRCLGLLPRRWPEGWLSFVSARPLGTCAKLVLASNCVETPCLCVIGPLGFGRWEEELSEKGSDIRIVSIES